MEVLQLAQEIGSYLSAKKAEDILIIDVREKTALCENLEEHLSKQGVEPRRTEGVREGRWGVLDYADVIVHVFNDDTRLFYHIERLWAEGENVRRVE